MNGDQSKAVLLIQANAAALAGVGISFDDAVQEKVTKLLGREEQLDGVDKPCGWLRTVVGRQAITLLRKGEKTRVQQEWAYHLLSLSEADRESIAIRVNGMLAVLGDRERSVVHALWIEGYTQRGAAEYLELSVSQVKTAEANGLAELQRRYGGRIAIHE